MLQVSTAACPDFCLCHLVPHSAERAVSGIHKLLRTGEFATALASRVLEVAHGLFVFAGRNVGTRYSWVPDLFCSWVPDPLYSWVPDPPYSWVLETPPPIHGYPTPLFMGTRPPYSWVLDPTYSWVPDPPIHGYPTPHPTPSSLTDRVWSLWTLRLSQPWNRRHTSE